MADDDSIHAVYDVVSSGKSISTFPRCFQEDMNFQCAVSITLTVSDAKAASLNPKYSAFPFITIIIINHRHKFVNDVFFHDCSSYKDNPLSLAEPWMGI